MENKNVFSQENKTDKKLKPFIIAFGIFIIVLAVFSVVLFMYSLDFDINNLIESTTEIEETTTEEIRDVYSVENLSGRSDVMFIITDDNDRVQTVFCTLVDFDNQTFKVKQFDGDAQYLFDENYMSINYIYSQLGVDGLNKYFNDKWGFSTDKYAIFTMNSFRKFLSSFNGIFVTVTENVNYESSSFNLELDKGYQSLSGEKAMNYFMICKDENKEKVLCEIISSVLLPEYSDNADKLFKKFANSSKTDISVIDFSDSYNTLETYCHSDDKFTPVPYYVEETNEENS
jgi:anionic cell wall polymer biosynthesis LytR-Cps2A-Psr (LCP) family protein